MRNIDYVLLIVSNPLASAELYTTLLGAKPVAAMPTFVLFALPNGMKLGLWGTADVQPQALPAGGCELSFVEENEAALLRTYAAWQKLGLKVLQEPTALDFGMTFVVQDPDGHRLRPFVPAARPS